jgi:hypothetical protein
MERLGWAGLGRVGRGLLLLVGLRDKRAVYLYLYVYLYFSTTYLHYLSPSPLLISPSPSPLLIKEQTWLEKEISAVYSRSSYDPDLFILPTPTPPASRTISATAAV